MSKTQKISRQDKADAAAKSGLAAGTDRETIIAAVMTAARYDRQSAKNIIALAEMEAAGLVTIITR